MIPVSKLLIANRGEIACRIIRTCRTLGIASVAVYSDADAGAPHVRLADEAVHIGPSPVGESYLVGAAIITAARATGAHGVHPGYGFLSENAGFAQACEAAGLVFIGPTPRAIEVMGDKARAKRAMIAAGVPCVPGYEDEDQSDTALIAAAKSIGYPVMVKASAGGGGRGMRLVHEPRDLPGALGLARSEAANAFGCDTLIIEKAIARPRHVEIQVFADSHGNTIHLGERDCSVQRRHQKVIEEAPCPVMTPDLRAAMGAAAVEAARAVDYCGAGTVEFLLDANGNFYFLEMNTRLQVEHPVTEAITGLDLVALQIAVARGEALPLTQGDVYLNGHAIEVRLYAEDPAQDFLPSTGPVRLWHPPGGEGIRVDAGIETGGEVSPFYDAMVAKIIAHGTTREEARLRLIAALRGTALFGPASNRDFLLETLLQPVFAGGEATTAFIAETWGGDGFARPQPSLAMIAPAIAIDHSSRRLHAAREAICVNRELLDWSSTRDLESSSLYALGETMMTLRVAPQGRALRISDGRETIEVEVEHLSGHTARLRSGDTRADFIFNIAPGGLIDLAGPHVSLQVRNLSMRLQPGADAAGVGTVTAPMHGKLIEILVSEGAQVRRGDTLAILEAMKMQHEILAQVDGVVASIAAASGLQISAEALILEITPLQGD